MRRWKTENFLKYYHKAGEDETSLENDKNKIIDYFLGRGLIHPSYIEALKNPSKAYPERRQEYIQNAKEVLAKEGFTCKE